MKRRFLIDSLEQRVLLSATPTARDDTFVAIANEPLVVKSYYSSLTISGPAVVGGVRNWIPPTSPFAIRGTTPPGTVQGTAQSLPSGSQAFKIEFSPADGPDVLAVGSYPTAQTGTPTNPALPTLNFSAVGLVSGASFASASFNVYRSSDGDGPFAADFELFSATDPGTPQVTGIYQDGDDGVLWNDASGDGGTLSASLVSGPSHGTLSLATNGTFTYTPASGFVGTDSFQYRATDSGGGGSSVATASILVGHDAAPTFTGGADQSVPQDDGPQTVATWATDQAWSGSTQSGHQLQFAIAGDTDPSLFSAGPVVDATTGTLAYTTAPGATGTAAVDVVLQDDDPADPTATVDSAPATLHITATVENEPPIALPAAVLAYENQFLILNVLTGASDPYGFGISAVLGAPPAHGTVQLSADGIVTYTPDREYTGPDSFTYLATDGRLSSAPATVGITVEEVNHAPSFTAGPNLTVDEDAGPQTIAGWASDLSPGPAVEANQTLTFHFTAETPPGLLSAQPAMNPATGDLTFTPALHATGTVSLAVDLQDSGGTANGGVDTSPAQTFTITIVPFVQPPVSRNDTFAVQPGNPLTVSAATQAEAEQSYFYAQSPGGGEMEATAGDAQFSATVTPGQFAASSTLVISIAADEDPADITTATFSYPAGTELEPGTYPIVSGQVTPVSFRLIDPNGFDGIGGNGSFTVVQNDLSAAGQVQFAATFQSGDAATSAGAIACNAGPVASVQSNDSDASGNAFTSVLDTAPAHGTLVFNPDGSFTYTPAAGFLGPDQFTYRDTDGTRVSADSIVTLNVAPAPSTAVSSTVTAHGTLFNDYPAANGTVATTPLADREVFDDLNGNGLLDPGEPTATTGLLGDYTLALPAGTESILPVPQAGWQTAPAAPNAVVADADGVAPPLLISMTDPAVVDVRAAYSDPMLSRAVTDPGQTIAGLFNYANRVFANSDTNVRLNLVDTRATDDPGDTTLDTILANLTGGPGTGGYDDVRAARSADHADVAVFFTTSLTGSGEVGVSWVLEHAHPDPGHGYAVVSLVSDPTQNGITLAHELGHQFGAQHDPRNAKAPGTYPFARGYIFTGSDGQKYRDVMSYGPESITVLPFFSTPQFSYAGHAMGTLAHGDNALAIRDAGSIVQEYEISGDEGSPAVAGAGFSASPPLIATLTLSSTAAPVPGAHGSAVVQLKNGGSTVVTGVVSVQLTLGGSTAVLTPARQVQLHLAPGRSLAVPLRFVYPAGMAAGEFTLQANLHSLNPTLVPSLVTGPAVRVAPLRVDLDLTREATFPQFKPNDPNSLVLFLTNTGTAPAVGFLLVTIMQSDVVNDQYTAPYPLPVIRQRIRLAVNAQKQVDIAVPETVGGQHAFSFVLSFSGNHPDTDTTDKTGGGIFDVL